MIDIIQNNTDIFQWFAILTLFLRVWTMVKGASDERKHNQNQM